MAGFRTRINPSNVLSTRLTMESETAQPQKCSCKCHKHAVAIFVVLFVAGAACWYIHHPNRPRSLDPKPGTQCTVILRDKELPLTGRFIAANREAIFLGADDTSGAPVAEGFWIPKSNIQYITIYK